MFYLIADGFLFYLNHFLNFILRANFIVFADGTHIIILKSLSKKRIVHFYLIY
jgi:hypothetical protein